ncbi:hypothetical protein EYF80_040463 [Liparis tanakae]|uniref:Uncharacterized protein n=1 Tax=Liparis tanakae TaxID=230148 RepID=A0A4Z2G8R4_9TELE|nr:hypothetical protein EYF80_040463 [Liparis tanakae]
MDLSSLHYQNYTSTRAPIRKPSGRGGGLTFELEQRPEVRVEVQRRVALGGGKETRDSLLRPLVMKVKPCVSMATPAFWMCSSAYLRRRKRIKGIKDMLTFHS